MATDHTLKVLEEMLQNYLFLERDGDEVNEGRMKGDKEERTWRGLGKEFQAFINK